MSIGAGLTRRRLVGGAVGLVVSGVASARAQGLSRFAAIRVDVQPLADRGGGNAARLIAAVLPGKMADSFAGRVGGGAGEPVLVARIDALLLPAFFGSPGVGFRGINPTDMLEGAGVVLSGRTVTSTTPLRVTLQPSYSGAYYLPDIDQRRITSLCESFASWLSREI